MTHARVLSFAGALFGLGAPAGLLAMRWGVQSRTPFAELASDPLLYIYVTLGTVLSMALFGLVLGRQEDRLETLSLTDALTGLANRRQFNVRLLEEVHRAERYRTPVALLIVDLDRFKRVNDKHGHLAGDRVLQVVATMVRDSFRASDIVCRYGGEEIAIIAPNTGLDEAMGLAERMRQRISQTVVPIAGEREQITVSVGLASAVGAHVTPEELTARADEALYDAKRTGRNRCRASDAQPSH